MAVIKKDGGNMSLPIGITRGNPQPLDSSEIYYDLDTLKAYAKTGATAYVGQRLVYVDETSKTITEYAIKNVDGDLLKVQSVASDAPSDLADRVSQLETETITSVVNGTVPSPIDLEITKSGRTVTINSGIIDKGISSDKLNDAINDSLDKADSALQKADITSGSVNGTISVKNTDVKVKGLTDTAYTDLSTLAKASDLTNKVDKITGEAQDFLYGGKTTTGEALVVGINTEYDATLGDKVVPLYNSNGQLNVEEPTEDKNATSKNYVDTGLSGKVDKAYRDILNDLVYGVQHGSSGDGETTFKIDRSEIHITQSSMAAGNTQAGYLPVYVVPNTNDEAQLVTGTPTHNLSAANKKYVDDTVNTAVSSGVTIENKGTGNIVTSVTKTGGKITVTNNSQITINEVADLQIILDDKAKASDLTALQTTVSNKVDKITSGPAEVLLYAVDTRTETPTQTLAAVGTGKTPSITSIPEYDDYNNLTVSETPRNNTDAASKKYVDQVKTDLAVGAVHFKGVVTTLPSGDELNNYSAGDIVILGDTKKEYILDNNKTWQEIGDESAYIPKNDNNIDNYLVDGSISQDKVNGLTTALASKVSDVKLDTLAGGTSLVSDGVATIPHATNTAYGLVKGSTSDNCVSINEAMQEMIVNKVTTDIIKNGVLTFVLDGGTASSLPTA